VTKSESDLRDLFTAVDTPAPPIDTARVIARARRRRLPRQVGAGAVGVLAIASIVVIGVPLTQPGSGPATTSMESAPRDDGASDSTLEIKRAPADRLNLCTGPLADFAPSSRGLILDVVFPPVAAAGSESVTGLVRLTNSGATAVAGSIVGAPAITLSQNDVVLWHSNGATGTPETRVELAPGETIEYSASFVPVRCGIEDDAAERFRSDLPPLAPGRYFVSAALDFLPDEGTAGQSPPGLDLVTSEPSPIDLQ